MVKEVKKGKIPLTPQSLEKIKGINRVKTFVLLIGIIAIAITLFIANVDLMKKVLYPKKKTGIMVLPAPPKPTPVVLLNTNPNVENNESNNTLNNNSKNNTKISNSTTNSSLKK